MYVHCTYIFLHLCMFVCMYVHIIYSYLINTLEIELEMSTRLVTLESLLLIKRLNCTYIYLIYILNAEMSKRAMKLIMINEDSFIIRHDLHGLMNE